MERKQSLLDEGGFYASFEHAFLDVVVRPANEAFDPFEVGVMPGTKGKLYMPISTPIYIGDLIEKVDPRGGVLESIVTEVEHNHDALGMNSAHAVVSTREKGRAPREYGATHIHISGGTNQFAVNSNNVRMAQSDSPRPDELVELLEFMKENAAVHLPPADADEVVEAAEDAIAAARDEAASPNKLRRVVYGVQGVLERIAQSATGGVNEGASLWAKEGAKKLLDLATGGGPT